MVMDETGLTLYFNYRGVEDPGSAEGRDSCDRKGRYFSQCHAKLSNNNIGRTAMYDRQREGRESFRAGAVGNVG